MTAILRAVRESALTAPQRLVIMTVASLSDTRSGLIPEQYRPTPDDLARYTNLSRATIYRTIGDIEAAGWIEVQRASERKSQIVAALIPDPLMGEDGQETESDTDGLAKSQGETKKSQGETARDRGMSQGETKTSQGETKKSQGETGTYIHGTPEHGPKDTTTPAGEDALFAVETIASKKPAPIKQDDPLFAAFWSAYPRKLDKGHGRKAWTAAIKRGIDPAAIISGAERFATHCARTGIEAQFVPHPSTWLNGERWTDQLPPADNTARPKGLIEVNGQMIRPQTAQNLDLVRRMAAVDAADDNSRRQIGPGE